jgi:hypothetical protein
MSEAENIQTIEDAVALLYETFITDKQIAEQRGIALRAMDQMIKMLGGEGAVAKFEAVPYSARLRARGKEIRDE